MADERKVKTQSVVLHDADGSPTTDKSKAVGAEAVIEYKDGGTERIIYRRDGKAAPSGV